MQLQTLPSDRHRRGAVQAAKAAASAKGAKGVGALKSEEFASLTAGQLRRSTRATTTRRPKPQKALGGLKKSFPGASVIDVSNHGGSRRGSARKRSTPAPGGRAAASTTPRRRRCSKANRKKGKSYEQKSKNLPNVISTG